MTIETEVATLTARVQFLEQTTRDHASELREGRELFAEIRDHLGAISAQAAASVERAKHIDEKLVLISAIDSRQRTMENKLPGLLRMERWLLSAAAAIIALVGMLVWKKVIG